MEPLILKLGEHKFINLQNVSFTLTWHDSLEIVMLGSEENLVYSKSSTEGIAILEALEFLDRQRRIEWSRLQISGK